MVVPINTVERLGRTKRLGFRSQTLLKSAFWRGSKFVPKTMRFASRVLYRWRALKGLFYALRSWRWAVVRIGNRDLWWNLPT